MNRNLYTIEFHKIIEQLQEFSYTTAAKDKFEQLEPYLSEAEVRLNLRETTDARNLLDKVGTPPLVTMNDVKKLVTVAAKGGMLIPEELEYLSIVLVSVKRLKDYLDRGKLFQISTSFYGDGLQDLEEIRDAISRSIRKNMVDDYASNQLRDIRKEILQLDEKMRKKADSILKNQKECFSDAFVVSRNGHLCLPVKKEYKNKITGSVIDKSSTGATLFVEPESVAQIGEELSLLRMDEENEVRKILYQLTLLVAEREEAFTTNLTIVEKLDFLFAKGKLSADMEAKAPQINIQRYITIHKGKHPLLPKDICVPLEFQVGNGIRGIIITGPNTGGKTVAIKTVGLLCAMAQCGLHVPCESADICMNNQILCDIGDGQNIMENLSTFSSHITNILDILGKVSEESLVILDELGSGTDPAEGMGIAIAILDSLKVKGCLFIATTHYPEVKLYTEKQQGMLNARMAFDRESLKPLYEMEIGKAGESCALYIAKRLGMSEEMIERARDEAYGKQPSTSNLMVASNPISLSSTKDERKEELVLRKTEKTYSPHIQKTKKPILPSAHASSFNIGDSVMIYPEKKLGIVCKQANFQGELMVQIKKSKLLINHKRLKLQVAAAELYPEDYDFSIVFDQVEVRKARHQMSKKYCEDTVITSSPETIWKL